MTREIVCRKIDGIVLRFGHMPDGSGFATQDDWNGATEEIIVSDHVFDPPLSLTSWQWTGTEFVEL